MKVAFWSNYPESGVTSNMVSVSTAMALMYQTTGILVTNHCGVRDLGQSVLGNRHHEFVRESFPDYTSGTGNRFLGASPSRNLRLLVDRHGGYYMNGNPSCEKEKGLYYYPQGRLYSDYLYEINYQSRFDDLVDTIEGEADYIFMDLQSQGSLCSLQELERADLVVVNLRQDENAIRNFFKRYQSIAGKCIFFISSYKEDGTYLKRDFIREYRIHPERVAVIPYNREIAAGFADGRIIPFLCTYINCGKKNPQYRSIWYIRYAAGILMRTLVNGIYNGTGALPEAK